MIPLFSFLRSDQISLKLYSFHPAVEGHASNVDLLDLTSMQWTESTPMPGPRSSAAGVIFEGKLLVVGGLIGGTTVAK